MVRQTAKRRKLNPQLAAKLKEMAGELRTMLYGAAGCPKRGTKFVELERKCGDAADGGSWNWSIWADQFRPQGYVPIKEFVHALTSVFAAAVAGRARAIGWSVYQRWITHLWQGKVVLVFSELAHRQQELGSPPDDAPETDPRCIVRAALTDLQNQQLRMDDPRYRQLGLPITSSHIESTIKELNSRVNSTAA